MCALSECMVGHGEVSLSSTAAERVDELERFLLVKSEAQRRGFFFLTTRGSSVPPPALGAPLGSQFTQL